MKRLQPLKRKSKSGLRKQAEQVYQAIMEGEPKDFQVWLSEKHFPDREYAEADLEGKEFYINTAKPLKELVNSYIHEFLHWQFPTKREQYILTLANDLEKQLTMTEKELILKAVIERSTWDD